MSIQPQPQPLAAIARNLLLDRLPVHERNAIVRGSETQPCVPGDVLLPPNVASEAVFFPLDAVISIVRAVPGRDAVQLAMVGSEGMVGIDSFLETRTQPDTAVALSGGLVYRMPAVELRRQFRRGGELQKHLLHYTGVYLRQVTQNAVCSRTHPIEARLARWLLMVQDRSTLREIHAPAGSLQELLGVDVDKITRAVHGLIAGKSIRHRGNTITITDREGLELSACDCYELNRTLAWN